MKGGKGSFTSPSCAFYPSCQLQKCQKCITNGSPLYSMAFSKLYIVMHTRFLSGKRGQVLCQHIPWDLCPWNEGCWRQMVFSALEGLFLLRAHPRCL